MPVSRVRLAPLLLLLPLAALAAWVWQRGKVTSPDRTAVLAALRASRGPVLPEAAAAGATSRTEPARFDKDTLYEAIDGAAEAYISRGLVSAVVATYSFASGGGPVLEISAEAHRFETEAGAAAQRAAERPPSSRPVGLPGAESDGAVLLAVRGRDYLKLTSLLPGPAAESKLEALARAYLTEKTE